MKCTNSKLISIFMLSLIFLTGCGSKSYDMAYSPDHPVSSYRINDLENNRNIATTFASDLCVVDGDKTGDTQVNMSEVGSAALFSLDDKETIYAQNVYEQLAPASLTKVMTALVALKYGSPEDMLTASPNVKITESGAQTCGLKEGDQMTLAQALHILLINSANDAAVLVAEGVGGSVEGFCELMNQEAKALGATNSNFMNPHGLTTDNHYVTAYDMYLIFNEALKYDLINEIINMPTYTTVYKDKSGDDKELTVNSTVLYLQGEENAPDSITVLGGKTGTTVAAGNCLILLTKDSVGKSYISIILRAEGREILYDDMSDLLNEIKN